MRTLVLLHKLAFVRLQTKYGGESVILRKEDREFRQAVCNELKDCKSANEIANKSFELMRVIADVSWEANASAETDKEAEELGVGK